MTGHRATASPWLETSPGDADRSAALFKLLPGSVHAACGGGTLKGPVAFRSGGLRSAMGRHWSSRPIAQERCPPSDRTSVWLRS